MNSCAAGAARWHDLRCRALPAGEKVGAEWSRCPRYRTRASGCSSQGVLNDRKNEAIVSTAAPFQTLTSHHSVRANHSASWWQKSLYC